MSINKNAAGNIVPVREGRLATGLLNSLNAEVVLDVDGDASALVYINAGAATFTGTFTFMGSLDGTNYFPVLAVPYAAVGVPPNFGQPLLIEAVSTTNVTRLYALKCGQMRKIRVSLTAWTSGTATCTIVADANESAHPAVFSGRPSTLLVTATAAVGVALTTTLPLVAGLRHYIDFINITKSAAVALTESANPILVTTTGLPGALVIGFPTQTMSLGNEVVEQLNFGSTGLSATAPGVATTIVAPATPGVIWRTTVAYRVGL